MFDRVKCCINVRRYRRRYPAATIDATVQLHDVRLGDGPVSIRGDAYLAASTTGSNVTVHPGCWVHRATLGDSIVLGPKTGLSNVTVGAFSYMAGHSTVHDTTFGRFCSVGKELLCGMGGHPTDLVSTSPVFYSTRGQCNTTFADRDMYDETAPVEVGSDVWIGARVFVRSGVRIGHGAIVGAGAVVVGDVPEYAVVAGTPAKVIRRRFGDDQIARLLELAWWEWDAARLCAGWKHFGDEDIEAFLAWAEGEAREGD